ncbi:MULTISPECIES: TetR/AcrR family transcriptional regulator [Rhodobacterales]|uniref:TetR/AcrR family transcriptional regulator n=1 Tax=Rhodobacterales TaxID=204455 RepID=UPI0032997B4E
MPRKPNYNRDDLIERARDLFWRQGWAGTSLKNLEAELNMKPGSFYAAFGSKDALFALALEKYASDGANRLRQLKERHGPLCALQRFPAMVVNNPESPAKACMLSRTLLELQASEHPLAELANQHLLKMEAQFCELFTHAQALEEISTKHRPDVLARRYQSDLLGLRVSAERNDVDAGAIAAEIAHDLSAL